MALDAGTSPREVSHTVREYDPPILVTASDGGTPTAAWLFVWQQHEDGWWWGFVRDHGQQDGGRWVRQDQLERRAAL